MSKLIIFRHGKSLWNIENKFTGWVDSELSEPGKEEARALGHKLKQFRLDYAYSSALKRAQETLKIVLEIACTESLLFPVYSEALNERMYGDLQGLNKTEIALKYGEVQLKAWRRSYDIAPPNGESLKETAERVIPYFEIEIMPKLKGNATVVISAHGNSLRALVMYLEKMTPDQISEFEIQTGVPRLYELEDNLQILTVENM
jgi:2,3-bisphosphoglycerate-dependent phosphoglycerate mutase